MKDNSILRFNPMTVVVLGMVSLTVGILTFWDANVELMSNLSGGLATFTGATESPGSRMTLILFLLLQHLFYLLSLLAVTLTSTFDGL